MSLWLRGRAVWGLPCPRLPPSAGRRPAQAWRRPARAIVSARPIVYPASARQSLPAPHRVSGPPCPWSPHLPLPSSSSSQACHRGCSVVSACSLQVKPPFLIHPSLRLAGPVKPGGPVAVGLRLLRWSLPLPSRPPGRPCLPGPGQRVTALFAWRFPAICLLALPGLCWPPPWLLPSQPQQGSLRIL